MIPSVDPIVSVSGTDGGVSILMDNGLNLQATLNTLNNGAQSWLSVGLALSNKVTNYSGAVVGLMGNFNGNKDDDISYRNGTILLTERKDSVTYYALNTCK